MLKVNRATEYALMSLMYMSRKNGSTGARDPQVATAKEISKTYRIPSEVTAKTLQKLKSGGLLKSVQGVQGGYVIGHPLEKVSLLELLQMLEGSQRVVGCCPAPDDQQLPDCVFEPRCEIRHFMGKVNSKVMAVLKEMTLAELTSPAALQILKFSGNSEKGSPNGNKKSSVL